jgi:hypothetical protein
MNYSYDVGLNLSIWVSAIVGVVALGTGALILVLKGRRQEAYDPFYLLVSLLAASVISLSLFCMIYAAVNPLMQLDKLSASWFRDELTTGALTLRVASFLVGGKALVCAAQFLFVEVGELFSTRCFERPSKHFEVLNDCPNLLTILAKTSSTCPNMVCT